MADNDSTAVRAMARPGYGKRLIPGQNRKQTNHFEHLPEREAYLAAMIDGMPEGSLMDIKTLAGAQPRYGQAAVSSALRTLTTAGHLRRVKETVGEGSRLRWAYRTWFSRVAHDDAWWNEFLQVDGSPDPPQLAAGPHESHDPEPCAGALRAAATRASGADVVPPARESAPAEPTAAAAYSALAELGRLDARLILSARDCAGLQGLASAWLAQGITREQLLQALTVGLPPEIFSPAAFTRTRLLNNMPPPPTVAAPEAVPARLRLMRECHECGVPGRPHVFVDGLCRDCRDDIAVIASVSCSGADGFGADGLHADIRRRSDSGGILRIASGRTAEQRAVAAIPGARREIDSRGSGQALPEAAANSGVPARSVIRG